MNNNDLKNFFHGVYDFLPCENGYMSFSRYSKKQREYLKFNDFFFVRTTFDGSITLEFTTHAEKFCFDADNNIYYTPAFRKTNSCYTAGLGIGSMIYALKLRFL